MRRPVSSAALIGLALATMAGGCAPMGPNYARPVVAVPDTHARQITPVQGRAYGDVPWAEQFSDPALGALVTTAIENNLDLRLAVARIQEFQARAGAQKANLAPQVGVSRDERGLPTAMVVNAQGKAELRTLKTGAAVGDKWLVISGLQDGDRLITEGLQKVKAGQPVKAVPAGSAPQPPAGAAAQARK